MKPEAFTLRDAVITEGPSVVVQFMEPALVERYTVEVIRPGPGAPTLEISIAIRRCDEDRRRAPRAVRGMMKRVAHCTT